MNASRSGLPVLPLAALLVSVAALFYLVGARSDLARALAAAEPRAIAARGDLAQDEQAVIALFESNCGSVAYIEPLRNQSYRDGPWSVGVRQVPEGTGSGFVWNTAGHVVTNFHVVKDSDGALVTLHDRTQYKATAVATYPDRDLAVLTIDAPPGALHPIALGTSADLRVGQKVFAIGNPFGLDYTLTHGLVSALGREMEGVAGRTIPGVIQTDAAINPGNSGGPLLDSAGRLVGINTMIYSPAGVSAGIGFAVPVDDVKRVVEQLIANGRVIRPGLGIVPGDPADARRLGVTGVPIARVIEGGSAQAAGLRGLQRRDGRLALGDVVVAVDGQPVPDADTLLNRLETLEIGQSVSVRVWRDGQEVDVPVALQELPPR